jgi:uncharacterized protein
VRSIGLFILGVFTWLAWLAVLATASRFAPSGYQIAVGHSAGLTGLGLACLFYGRRCFGSLWAGTPVDRKEWALAGTAVLAIYLLNFGYTKAFGIPPEPWMANAYVGKTPFQIAALLVAVVAVVPVAEEMAFRYFLFGTVPFKSNRACAIGVVAVTAAIFALVHAAQYRNPSTLIVMFSLGVAFGVARIVSGGLALPIAMHMGSAVVGGLLNELR